ncbi:hypothetical protein COLO4_34933 [Corchorus olitorius]|uniref:TIR domain-containing protein n=1 Tax=Corchorus olitorius TaxID=93759 RepID=A0A1R3GIT5_9ROSI|nr:hypothetical protein COLO4_34933 [Corchorus olitorius]
MLGFSSLSSPFNQRKFKYGIFLSFCGKDTRKSFTDHLHSALLRKDIKTFRDYDSLERGEEFAPELLRAIRESWGSIIVFSEGYAFSRWCLDELVEIMEQREERGHMVYPIFYHVDPSDFRHQTNKVGEAFKKHEGRYNNDQMQRWRHALQQVTVLDEQEVEKLKDSFRTIQANLVDAENKVYMKGETEKVRYDKLKRIAYDIDVVLDEYNTAILKSKIERDHQAQTPSTSSSLLNKVHRVVSTTSWSDGIAPKIKELNKRVAREKDYLSLAIDENGGTDSKLERTKTTSFIDEFVVSGRDQDKKALIRLLLN